MSVHVQLEHDKMTQVIDGQVVGEKVDMQPIAEGDGRRRRFESP